MASLMLSALVSRLTYSAKGRDYKLLLHIYAYSWTSKKTATSTFGRINPSVSDLTEIAYGITISAEL